MHKFKQVPPPNASQSRPRLSKRSLLQAERKDTLLDTGGLPLRRGSGTISSSNVSRDTRHGSRPSMEISSSQHTTQGSHTSSAQRSSQLLRSPTASPRTARIGNGGILDTSSFAMSRQGSATSLSSQSGLNLGRRRLMQTSSGSGHTITTSSRPQAARSPVKHTAQVIPRQIVSSAGQPAASSSRDRRTPLLPHSERTRMLGGSPIKSTHAKRLVAAANLASTSGRPASANQPSSAVSEVIYVTSGSEDDRVPAPSSQHGQRELAVASPRHQPVKISPQKRERPSSLLSGSSVARNGLGTPKKARFGPSASIASNPFLVLKAGGSSQPVSPSKDLTPKARKVETPADGPLSPPDSSARPATVVAPSVVPSADSQLEKLGPSLSPLEKRLRPANSVPEDPPSFAPQPSQASTTSGLASRTPSTETQASESGRAKRARPSAGTYTIPEFDAPDDEWRDRAGRSIPLVKSTRKRTTTGSSAQHSESSQALGPKPASGPAPSPAHATPSQQTPQSALPSAQSSQASANRHETPTPKPTRTAPRSANKARALSNAASPSKPVASALANLRTPVKNPIQPASEMGSPLTPLPKDFEDSADSSTPISKVPSSSDIKPEPNRSAQANSEGTQKPVDDEEEDLVSGVAQLT